MAKGERGKWGADLAAAAPRVASSGGIQCGTAVTSGTSKVAQLWHPVWDSGGIQSGRVMATRVASSVGQWWHRDGIQCGTVVASSMAWW